MSTISADELLQHIEAIETLEAEKAGIAESIKDRYALMKGEGYDTKTVRTLIKLRAMEAAARQEAEALLETYKSALGLD